MSQKKDRRNFIKKTAVVAMGGVAGGVGFSIESLAQTKIRRINRQATIVMPNGKLRTRAELMKQLGLNPQTPPDAWLAICGGGCGSNASALDLNTRQKLIKRGFKFQGKELISAPRVK
ncbi:Tat (twin-arginine translocation) pathway signal sequence [Desulfocicer vacuolatum DSM 3385]|uniref:Tat (Twin-arginine translocation) pathway signal sequence n=1 Tax=Desulfocicer vacuolatum DSM 3385 TaxID=1121400 RepID=A0A1W2C6Y6_9BACT|nr:twin-arginine translocation signal domain-containing protein [Desulfocicer vacuolatum]SMC80913.1 Tat (twin-arginine translocation) pathway signal sequence [Desulfocicer vacuolatum DSM 3385]